MTIFKLKRMADLFQFDLVIIIIIRYKTFFETMNETRQIIIQP